MADRKPVASHKFVKTAARRIGLAEFMPNRKNAAKLPKNLRITSVGWQVTLCDPT